MHPANRRRPGFTLVELLVVIGIIALLIGILMPALARARQHAVNIQCLSNLRQQGQAAFIYANYNKGFLPSSLNNALYRFSQSTAEQISRTLRGNTKVFYCPANALPAPGTQDPIVPEDFYPPDHGGQWIGSPIKSGRILYWWLANPNGLDWDGTSGSINADGFVAGAPAGTVIVYRDFNENKHVRDEYMRKIGDKGASQVVISTDQSGQMGAGGRGWFFIHGNQAWLRPTGSPTQQWQEAKRLHRAWKNNLYGDGHAESKRPDEVHWRWGPSAVVGY